MGNISRVAAIAPFALVALVGGCGSGGGAAGSGAGNSTGSAFGVVSLLAHDPADGAVQVGVDAVLTFEFDAPMALESFGDPETWLRVAGSTDDVPVTFTRGSGGRVACRPDGALAPETDYVLQLSALTCDQNGRILDRDLRFSFRTYDATPPTALGLDVPNGATGVARTATFRLSFDERLDEETITPQSLYLRDLFGGRFAIDASVDGDDVVIRPLADLPGNREFFVVATTALRDRAGNPLQGVFQTGFETVDDTDQPSVVSAWPALNAAGISPLVQPSFTFDESMDPDTVEAASLLFQDEFGSIVPFAIDASRDQRELRIRPLVALEPQREYTIAFLLGGAAATDVSGNGLTATQALNFTTGSDQAAPAVVASTPAAGETRAPGALVAEVTFDEPLDAAWIGPGTVELLVEGRPWAAVVEHPAAEVVRVTPIETLPTGSACTLRLRGGQAGLRDLAGNVPPTDVTIGFTTSADAELPEAIIMPPDGAVSVATTSRISVVFDAPMDPATLTPATIQVTDDFGTPLAGQLELGTGDRVVAFTPTVPLADNTYYRVRLVGGSAGPRRLSGNWFDSDRTSRFRTSAGGDTTPPSVTASINEIPDARREGLVLPPSGFHVEVATSDLQGQWVDMGSIECVFEGGVGPASEVLLAAATIGYNTFTVEVPFDAPLASGSWTLTVRARDLSGNVGTSNVIAFQVDEPSAPSMPFERTQVVWVRSDLDRDGNGRPDFDDDMLRLGFATEGDPAGSNGYVRRVLLDAILAKANQLYGRGDRGEPLDTGSVPLRFSPRQPIALAHMQIALGGLDPEGNRYREYGDESTGVLGRAYYDYRNANVAERNTATSPGLGVFPAEMWLYQTDIHLQVYPSYQTVFASRFLPICPAMGGTPAGSHPLDAVVLAPGFDYAAATTQERARWNTIMAAADDWAAVIGVILAHEVGHSVGLVAPGAMPSGLFGDSSLHDTYAGAAEVMAPSVGYEAMTTLEYRFRDIDLAYLRQRILLR